MIYNLKTKLKNLAVSEIIILINIVIYVIMYIYDSSFSINTIATFGAKVNFLIADGQYFRFISPIFLHLSFYHLGFNSLSLYILGRDLEIIFGKRKFLIIFFVSGFISTLSSFILNESISAGASGAVFGLLGAHVFLYFSFKDKYKKLYGNTFLILILVNLVYGFIQPNIDNIGHLGGLVGGIIISYALSVKSYKMKSKNKFIVFILIPIILTSITSYSIISYKKTVEYHIYKSFYLIEMNELKKAENAISIGYSKFPMYSDFDYLKNLLETK